MEYSCKRSGFRAGLRDWGSGLSFGVFGHRLRVFSSLVSGPLRNLAALQCIGRCARRKWETSDSPRP